MPNISRTKTWASGETLTASDLNAEFNGVLAGINDSALDADNLTLSDAYAWTGLHTFNNANTIFGHTSALTTNAANQLQVLGTADADTSGLVGRFSADASGGQINFLKSRHASIGSNTIVQDNDVLGGLYFYGADGSDFATPGASIFARINGTPGANDLPTELVFSTTADAGNSTTERLRISQAGLVEVVGDLSVGDDVTLSSDSAVLSMGAGNDVTLTHDGTTGVTIAATPITVDSGGNLTLDAHTGIHIFKDAGSEVLRFTEGNSGDVTIKLATDGKDLVFTDNGDATNLKILDAAAGINVPGEVQTTKLAYTDGDDALTIADGGGLTVAQTLGLTKDTLVIGGVAVTTTAAELNILDTATVTAAELNLIDGGTARGTTAVASGDGILINDAGTMRMTNVDTVSTYFASHSVGGSNIVTTGALNSGSITSGFGTIDTGSSTITTTGVITGGGFTIGSAVINEAELETIDGVTAGTVTASKAVVVDSNKDIGTFRNITIDGTFSDGNYTFDTSGNVSGLGTIGSGAITATDTTAPLILKYDGGEYVTHAVSSAGVYSIATTDASSDSGAITLDTVDSITLDSDTATEGVVYADGGTNLLRISNSSSDVIIKPLVDAKDIVFQQFDGNEVCRVADNRRLYFYDEGGEYISSSGSALTIASGGVAWELPTADGSDGEVLKTDGSGNLDWVANSGSGVDAANGANNRIATFSDSDSLNGEANLLFDGQGLGIGATPLGTQSNYSSATIGGNGFVMSTTSAGAGAVFVIAQNAHFDTDNSWEYISTDEASRLIQSAGNFTFATAPSGTGGNDATFTDRFYIGNTGNVGVAMTNPAHKLDVTGTAGLSTGTAWTNTSDARIKQNVATITGATDKLKRLRPVSFRYTAQYISCHPEIDADKTYNSFIADEYAQVFPDAVTAPGDLVRVTPASGNTPEQRTVLLQDVKQYTPHDLTMYLVRAIQELDARIAALE